MRAWSPSPPVSVTAISFPGVRGAGTRRPRGRGVGQENAGKRSADRCLLLMFKGMKISEDFKKGRKRVPFPTNVLHHINQAVTLGCAWGWQVPMHFTRGSDSGLRERPPPLTSGAGSGAPPRAAHGVCAPRPAGRTERPRRLSGSVLPPGSPCVRPPGCSRRPHLVGTDRWKAVLLPVHRTPCFLGRQKRKGPPYSQ